MNHPNTRHANHFLVSYQPAIFSINLEIKTSCLVYTHKFATYTQINTLEFTHHWRDSQKSENADHYYPGR